MVGIDLERLFRTPGQVAVLRALWKAPADLTGRQVQQLAGVHNRTAMTCLADLERLGVLQHRTAGRAYLYSLKRSHRMVRDLVDPVFAAEQAAPRRFAVTLGAALAGHCLSAVIYGSVARGRKDAAGDVDLLVVVRDDSSAEAFAARAQDDVERLVREDWGMMLEVNLKTRRQLVKEWDSRLLKQIVREGRLIAGKPLAEVIRGRK